jgi:hypothetical protein
VREFKIKKAELFEEKKKKAMLDLKSRLKENIC